MCDNIVSVPDALREWLASNRGRTNALRTRHEAPARKAMAIGQVVITAADQKCVVGNQAHAQYGIEVPHASEHAPAARVTTLQAGQRLLLAAKVAEANAVLHPALRDGCRRVTSKSSGSRQ